MTTNTAPPLSVPRGAALYIGALLGPGVLLLPGLAASIAGPAAILAWAGLLGVSALFAVMFTALGTRYPGEGGVSAYAAAGLGPRAGYAVGWSFLLGVVAGAPVVCLIGGGYVASLAGGGQAMATAVAAGLLLAVLGLALAGMRASTGVQMVLVVLLVAVVVAGVAGSAPAARMANWHPFAPHGWAAVGKAASVIMLSFVGWEAVAPLTARFGNARRRLPRVVAIAFGTTAALYLTMAAATTAVLGHAAGGSVPLADLLAIAIGPAGRAVAAGAAVLLTLGAVNAYLSGAAVMARSLTARAGRDGAGLNGAGQSGAGPERAGGGRPSPVLLIAIAATGLLVIAAASAHLVTTTQLVTVPTALFLTVYLGCTAAASRVLRGPARVAAAGALAAVAVIMVFSGGAAVVAVLTAGIAAALYRRRPDESTGRGDVVPSRPARVGPGQLVPVARLASAGCSPSPAVAASAANSSATAVRGSSSEASAQIRNAPMTYGAVRLNAATNVCPLPR
jgi:amino acid efflux transporter